MFGFFECLSSSHHPSVWNVASLGYAPLLTQLIRSCAYVMRCSSVMTMRDFRKFMKIPRTPLLGPSNQHVRTSPHHSVGHLPLYSHAIPSAQNCSIKVYYGSTGHILRLAKSILLLLPRVIHPTLREFSGNNSSIFPLFSAKPSILIGYGCGWKCDPPKWPSL